MYLLIIAISEYVFNRHVDWWTLIYLTLMPIFFQGVPRLPETKIYNRIFSINWIMPMYVLALAYLGALLIASCLLWIFNRLITGVMTSMISSPKEPEYIMDPHNVAYAKVRYILDTSDNSSAIYKVSIKSPWTVVWFSHIIYCLSDYQRLYKQLPS